MCVCVCVCVCVLQDRFLAEYKWFELGNYLLQDLMTKSISPTRAVGSITYVEIH